jgi:flagellar motor protein MotB
MARARAFARVLSSDFGIPLAAMRAAAGDTVRAPYPNDTETSRARNRTVVLRLVRHAGN